MDTPLDSLYMEIFTDGSSFVWDGKRKAGQAVVAAEQILEANYYVANDIKVNQNDRLYILSNDKSGANAFVSITSPFLITVWSMLKQVLPFTTTAQLLVNPPCVMPSAATS